MTDSVDSFDSTPNDARETRQSLVLRLKDAQDGGAWEEFYAVYSPLLYEYARARGLQHSDADDVRSECLAAVVRQMPEFDYDRARGGFRAWLRTIVVRRIIDRLRIRTPVCADSRILGALVDDEPTPDDLWEREWRHQHLRYSMEAARSRVNRETWEIFQLLIDQELPVSEVCTRMRVTANHVYKARRRVLVLIREKMLYLQADPEDSGLRASCAANHSDTKKIQQG